MNTREMIVWVFGIAAAAVVLLSPAGCTMHRQYRVEQAIKAGADPADAKCAIEADMVGTVCVLRAIKQKQQP